MKRLLKLAVRRLAAAAGQQVISDRYRLDMQRVLMHARTQGVTPNTLIDLGVAWGTPELYAAFPHAKLLLVEPNADWEATLKKLCLDHGGSYAIAASGAERGRTQLHLRADDAGGSSTHAFRHDGYPVSAVRDVDVIPVDELVVTLGAKPPFVLKIDTQGGELGILRGASATLPHCELVLIETSLFTKGTNLSSFAETIAFMAAHGFAPYDFYEPKYRPFDRALDQIDVAFAPENGVLRRVHDYLGRT